MYPLILTILTGLAFAASLSWLIASRTKPDNVTIAIPAGAPPPEIERLSTTALPGFSAELMIKIDRGNSGQPARVFDRQSPEGAHVALALSGHNSVVLTVTDVPGKAHPLEIPLGGKGIPPSDPIHLSCDVGLTGHHTLLRVLVDGRMVAYREIPTPLDLGTHDWNEVPMLTAPIEDADDAPFKAPLISVAGETLTDQERTAYRAMMQENLKKIGGGYWVTTFAD